MALQNAQFDEIMRSYSRKQNENRRLLEERRQAVYQEIPRIQEIDQEIAALSASKARALLQGTESSIADLTAALKKLTKEQLTLLTAYGYAEDSLSMQYSCPICEDTGFVDGKKCSCFLREELDYLYRQSGLDEVLQKETFEHFSFEYYSDTMLSDVSGSSPRALAEKAYRSAMEFVSAFGSSDQNLFLYGNTGVGKTFLSHCIAGALIRKGFGVLYFSAYDLFELLAQETFGGQSGTITSGRILDCDLLIIDDLGTELTNSFVSSQLFLCINERLARRKATIISTNLLISEFSELYSERTFSRIVSNYQMLKLAGEDIRLQKKLSGGK